MQIKQEEGKEQNQNKWDRGVEEDYEKPMSAEEKEDDRQRR